MTDIDQVSQALGALSSDVQTLKAMTATYGALAATHGTLLIEVRDLARATNGRVTAVEKTLAGQDAEIAIVKKTRMDHDAVTVFLSSLKGKVAVLVLAAGGLASLAASVRALIP